MSNHAWGSPTAHGTAAAPLPSRSLYPVRESPASSELAPAAPCAHLSCVPPATPPQRCLRWVVRDTTSSAMNTIKHTRKIAVPADFLFDYSQRNSCRLDWDPFVSSVVLHDRHDLPSEGTEVTVHTWNRMSMTCRYVQFRRPECIAIKMLSGPKPLRTFGGTWRFEATDSHTTSTTFVYSFTLHTWLRLFEPLARLYFRWDMWRRLKALQSGSERAYSSYRSSGLLPWTPEPA